MEIVEQAHMIDQNLCNTCHKKQQLIQKYENLITLLKKKADRSHISQLSVSNKLSIGDRTTSHTSFNGVSKSSRFILPILLNKLQTSIKTVAFNQIKCQSYTLKCKTGSKILTILNELCKNKQKQYFQYLKKNHSSTESKQQNVLCSQSGMEDNNFGDDGQKTINKTIGNTRQRSNFGPNSPLKMKSIFSQPQQTITIDHGNYKSLTMVHEDFISSISQTQKQQSLPLMFFKRQSSAPVHQMKNLYKKLFILQQQNFSYQQKIKSLQVNMQQALNRQIKQNQKKTQSLEMFAQQMLQKNELIQELQQKITMLQQKYECETNGVLQDQLTQHRKQVDRLEKINIRLQNQARRTKQKLAETQTKITQLQQCKKNMSKENLQLKQGMFELEQKIIKFQMNNQNFKKSCFKIQKLLEKLRYHQKSLSRISKSIRKSPLSQVTPIQEDKNQLEQLYKLELVFIYLYNIEDQSYSFSEHQFQFDEQQLQVLKQLKKNFIDLKSQLQKKKDNLMETIQHENYGLKQTKMQVFQGRLSADAFYTNKAQNNQQNQHEDVYCHQNMVDGSIFDVLNQQKRDFQYRLQVSPNSRATSRLEPQKNLTMKLLQMQLQKNKQIQKISELKQRNMYVRNIILNLMKSLQIKQNNLKTQTSGILALIFDVFQYSEQQKQIMFTHAHNQAKQRRFFGFI